MAWHVRYRHDPAHRWLRSVIGELAKEVTAGDLVIAMVRLALVAI